MKVPNPQGQKACYSGAMLEKNVESMLVSSGFEFLNTADAIHELRKEQATKKWYARQFKGMIGVYRVPVVVDFILAAPGEFSKGLIIEVKYQKVTGSIDEKYPYVFLNFKEWLSKGIKAALFMEGGGYRDCVLDWCRENETPDISVVEGTSDIIQWMLSFKMKIT